MTSRAVSGDKEEKIIKTQKEKNKKLKISEETVREKNDENF